MVVEFGVFFFRLPGKQMLWMSTDATASMSVFGAPSSSVYTSYRQGIIRATAARPFALSLPPSMRTYNLRLSLFSLWHSFHRQMTFSAHRSCVRWPLFSVFVPCSRPTYRPDIALASPSAIIDIIFPPNEYFFIIRSVFFGPLLFLPPRIAHTHTDANNITCLWTDTYYEMVWKK